ncbi:uncharacterized protein cubi_03224 [Cryptosporidium ubiquitum]|uniref:Uncharacterized protein n=1 Tax=Cryptosporidium ubiquitum TaxID=857276 RepID=A0A1J4M9N3_9CRYT|nr:uncharacterized protein cubi_03224 [Cryptosporidium ubiquitum]OII70926.1 hypothetical protein cubi_03224 [Cryptosporidium ubiquitum]
MLHKTFVHILFALLFFYIKYFRIECAGVSDKKTDLGGEIVSYNIQNTDIGTLDEIQSIITNKNENNFIVEQVILKIINYIILILKLLFMYDPAAGKAENIFISAISDLFVSRSIQNRKIDLIQSDKALALRNFCDKEGNASFLEIINGISGENTVKLFDMIAENALVIENTFFSLIKTLKILVTLDLDTFLKNTAELIIAVENKYIDYIRKYSKIHNNESKRNKYKRLVDNQKYIKGCKSNLIDLTMVDSNKPSETAEKDRKLCDQYIKSKELDKSGTSDLDERGKYLFEEIFDCSGFSEEEVFIIETIVLYTLNIIEASISMLYMFDADQLSSFNAINTKLIDICSLKISTRSTKSLIGQEKAIKLRIFVQELLGLSELNQHNILELAVKSSLEKNELIKQLKDYYKGLLKIVLILEDKLKEIKCKYLISILESPANLFMVFTKFFASEIKRLENLSFEYVFLDSIVKYTELKLDKIRSDEDRLIEQSKSEREMEKENKRKEKQMKEKKRMEELIERKRYLEEHNKLKQEKKNNSKPKVKKQFPNVEDLVGQGNYYRASSSRTRSTSRSRSKTPEKPQNNNGQSSELKVSRKEKRMQKLQQEELKSQMKQAIKEAIQEQKSQNISTKKRKQTQRKNKNSERREKEERERKEEKEKRQEKLETIKHNNYMYSLINSVEMVEGLFEEAKKQQEKGLRALIGSILDIVKEEVSSEESKRVEALTEKFEEFSILASEVDLEPKKAPDSRSISTFTSSSGKPMKLRADHVPGSGPVVQTIELFGPGATFATRSRSPTSHSRTVYRGRTRSRKRSESGSRTRSESGSEKSSESKFRKRSRSGSGTRSKSRSRASSKSRMSRRDTRESEIDSEKIDVINFDGFTVPYLSHFDEKKSHESSKFAQFFSSSEDLLSTENKKLLSQHLDTEITEMDYSEITENSTNEEIINALEKCGDQIKKLHIEVAPFLTGKSFLSIKLIEKSLIKAFVRLLILLKKKDGNFIENE